MKVRSWASNEFAFIDKQIDKLATFIKATEKMLHDIQIVYSKMLKRFDSVEVASCERKRKMRRQKEHRAKIAKKQKIKQLQSADNDSDSDIPIDILDDEL